MSESAPVLVKETAQLSDTQSIPEVPPVITRKWIEEALQVGYVENEGKRLFVRRNLAGQNDTIWLTDTYGFSVPGSNGSGYIFHGTSVETLPVIVKEGIF